MLTAASAEGQKPEAQLLKTSIEMRSLVSWFRIYSRSLQRLLPLYKELPWEWSIQGEIGQSSNLKVCVGNKQNKKKGIFEMRVPYSLFWISQVGLITCTLLSCVWEDISLNSSLCTLTSFSFPLREGLAIYPSLAWNGNLYISTFGCLNYSDRPPFLP